MLTENVRFYSKNRTYDPIRRRNTVVVKARNVAVLNKKLPEIEYRME